MSTPYAAATTGTKAREEITKILRRFGCEEIGFADNLRKQEIRLYFTHRGRRDTPTRVGDGLGADVAEGESVDATAPEPRVEYEEAALRQGHVAVNTIFATGSRDRSRRSSAASSRSRRCSSRGR